MSFLSRMHSAAHGDLADYRLPIKAAGPDIEAARAAGYAAETARIAERVATIRSDQHIAADPARLAAALALAPSSMSIADIKAKVAGVFDPQALAAAVAEKWAPRAAGEPDPLAATDQTGRPDAGRSWSAVIAAQAETTAPTGGKAVASGGPHPVHPSAFAGE